ncbi:MAG: RagB/SusD family nutrient uptake outer membrane protein [Candidatus Cryptobacteroides sp.]|nr:RagB/SusD family nutrient uptake outer membrane protein [Candidatus Cryptobacteroides sp.]MDY4916600.1 RagB/SusD family nutrient uptake outer membrane protein [Candidatus Cryptobacteroides sp.]
MKKTIYTAIFLCLAAAAVSCDKFLDKLPDNRAEIDSVEKVRKLLVTAYSSRTYVRYFEYASDNVDFAGEKNPNTSQLLDQNYAWEAMTVADNESNVNVWQNYYKMIASANAALEAIEKCGTPEEMLPYKGEALLCRAYAHFCLTMIYCLPYHPQHASSYLGVPYIDAPETTLNPKYVRGTLEEDYRKIEQDIEEALPLINDEAYTVPKYHFNKKAAYAFATRFYCYSLQWEKAVKAAEVVLGSNPSEMLRDWAGTAKLSWGYESRTMDYIDPLNKFSLLLIPLYTSNGTIFNAWSGSGSRFTHNNRVAKKETFRCKRPMGGPYDTGKDDCYGIYQHPPFLWYDNITNKVWMPKWPNQWEVVDAVAGTGYSRSTFVAFTANEVLLNRAEAYIQLKQYDLAAADLETWNKSFYKVGQYGIRSLTPELIDEVYSDPSSSRYIPLYTREEPTSRKELHPHGFTVEAGRQENMTQCLLFCRRLDFLGEGLRWCDVKRYGITVDRFDDTNYDDETTTGYKAGVSLPYNDLRRALQIPQESIKTGLEPNPDENSANPGHPFVSSYSTLN